MRFTLSQVSIPLIVLNLGCKFVEGAILRPNEQLEKRDQCALTLGIAENLVNALQNSFWDGNGYVNGITWTDANTYEDINNLMLAASLSTWDYVNTESTLAQLGLANAGNWDAFFQGSFDDSQASF
ncbi:glycoside hydrolase family 76 protein [Sphaerobolus stellatus SS14]|uniref:Glycoside hydrolase family 76 protein n=1 Tax=Sphaerobolus stellatus (strain SS14) TaxID=990650 RepID=A0A0C9VKX3_SPHS4|nr:glycoside hydrolase family 76 protein [Sphaerobolus stellatus SS14]